MARLVLGAYGFSSCLPVVYPQVVEILEAKMKATKKQLEMALGLACQYIYDKKLGGCRECPCTQIISGGYEYRVCFGPKCEVEISKVFLNKVACAELYLKAKETTK